MLQLSQAEHAETAPGSALLLIDRLSCSLVGQEQEVILQPGSHAARIYGRATCREQFLCSYGLNPRYAALFCATGLTITGRDSQGEARLVELAGHPFFMASLYVPQMHSSPGRPHPLLTALLAAAG